MEEREGRDWGHLRVEKRGGSGRSGFRDTCTAKDGVVRTEEVDGDRWTDVSEGNTPTSVTHGEGRDGGSFVDRPG